ncbi:MAG: glycosyltransferase family 39 protein [Limnothrix sp.]
MQQSHPLQRWYQTFEKYTVTTRVCSAIALGLLGAIAFLWRLGSTGLVDETEPMFAEAARQMLVTGDWITPYYNDVTRFDKPPLVYWLMAIAYKIVGVNAWGARLPSALAAIALMAMIFLVLKKFGFPTAAAAENPEHPQSQRKVWLAAWIGSSLIALNLHTIVWARMGVSDMLLNGCMGSGLVCFFFGYATGGKQINRWLPNAWYLAAYICLALAVLTKGPVGIALPGLTIIAFLAYLGRFWSVFLEAKPLTGAIVFSVITVPWYVLVILRNGQTYLDTFFGYHNYERFTGVVNGHDAPWYFYFPVILIGFIPWSIYLPAAIARLKLHHVKQWREQPRHAHLGIFAGAWFFTIFGFFTIAVTKLPSYTIPLLPAASILIALLWSHLITEPQQPSKFFWWSGAVNVLMLAFLSGFLLYSPNVIGFDPAAPNLAESFKTSIFPVVGAITWAIAAIVALWCLFKSRLGLFLTNAIALLAFILFTLLPVGALLDQNRQANLREIADTIKAVQRPQEEVVMVGFEKPSLVFYSGQNIRFFERPSKLKAYFAKEDKGEETILLISREKEMKPLSIDLSTVELIQQAEPYSLIRLRKQTIYRKS